MNIPTLIVLAIIVAVVALIIVNMIKKGKVGGCGCDCANCDKKGCNR